MSSLDLKRLARILALSASDQDGEALTALRKATALMKQASVGWADLLTPQDEMRVATEALAVLLAENNALKAELEELRASSGKVVTVWSNVRATPSATRRAARWALDLNRKGSIKLSPTFELSFMEACARWKGRLTPRMQPIFDQILEAIEERTGLSPPA